MKVKLYYAGDHVVLISETTLDQFIEDNIDGLSEQEIEDIKQTLSREEPYHGGGGAEPEWILAGTD